MSTIAGGSLPAGREPPSTGVAARVSLVALLALQAYFTLVPIHSLGAAWDERAHIGAAYYLLQEGSDDLNREHPTLAKRLAAAGLATAGRIEPLPDHRRLDQWQLGDALLYDSREPRDVLVRARLPFVPCALGLTLVAFFWARGLAGTPAALASAATAALSPVLNAHGALVLTDMPLALFALAASASTWASVVRSSAWWAAIAGACAAAAAHAKYPGLLVASACGLVLLASFRPREARDAAARIAAFALAAAATFLLLLDDGGLGAYLAGVRTMGANHRPGFLYYLFGAASPTPFAAYFPATMLLKSTPVELLGMLGLVPLAIAAARRGRGIAALALVGFPLAYLATLVLAAPNLGHRYTTPLYGFLYVGVAFAVVAARARLQPLVVAGIVAIQLAVAIVATPDPLSYFNGLLGCRGGAAFRCLDDSNIDFGQNLGRVAEELGRRGVARDALVVDTPVNLERKGVLAGASAADWDDWLSPRPAMYVVSGHNAARRLMYRPELADSPLARALERSPYFASHFFVDLRPRAGTAPPPGPD